jgi:hypothetical protein
MLFIFFVWDSLASNWEKGFSNLETFRAREGHCRVPQDFVEDGFKLGQWVGYQLKRKDQMSPERRQRLDAFGFVWTEKKDRL